MTMFVEFADVNGVAYAIATIPTGQLMKLKHAPFDRLRKRESSARAPYRVAFRPASWPPRPSVKNVPAPIGPLEQPAFQCLQAAPRLTSKLAIANSQL